MSKHDDELENKAPQAPETTKSNQTEDDRRKFLTKSSVMVAAFGLLSTSGSALAQEDCTDPEALEVQRVLDIAIETGDIKSAVRTSKLSPRIQEELLQLTPDDLGLAARLTDKLDGLRDVLSTNNNGIIGM